MVTQVCLHIKLVATRKICCSLNISRGNNIRMLLPRQNDLVAMTYYHVPMN